MFWSVIYPGLIFLGAFCVRESPRWLFRRGKKDQALAAAPLLLGGGSSIGDERNGEHGS